MAKTRAARRREREADRERRIQEARAKNESQQRIIKRRVASQPSLLAATRRRRARTALFIAIFINALVWILSPSWSLRTLSLVLSLLAAPLIAVLFVSERSQ